MPISQKPNETGWFYHAPAKKVVMDKVDYPAPSQIPGIGYENPDDYLKDEVREMVFKDTDSDYIRMAKMGGRKDLLSFDPSRNKHRPNKQSQNYQRSDWFYLEDNRMEDEEKKEAENKEWEFLLPDYMVHQGYKPSFENPATPPTRGSNASAKAPYSLDRMLAHDTDPADNNMGGKIPEPRKEGYGVRNQKPPPKMQPLPPKEKSVGPESVAKSRGRSQFTVPSEREVPTNMMKLLSGEYEREWHEKHAEYEKTSKGSGKPAGGDSAVDSTAAVSATRRPDPQAAISAAAARRKAREEEERELFKLQRFKNVPSKIDSHQRPEIMAYVK